MNFHSRCYLERRSIEWADEERGCIRDRDLNEESCNHQHQGFLCIAHLTSARWPDAHTLFTPGQRS